MTGSGSLEQDSGNKSVGEFVAADYRTAKVFEKYGIDFCCGGKIPLLDACRGKGIDPGTIQQEIEAAKSEPLERSLNYAAWELSFLSDYIVTVHHAYIKENSGQIAAYAHKIAEVHGAHHPEVKEIAVIFDKIATDMAAHLHEEEETFFPAVKRADTARKAGNSADQQDIGAIRACLAKLRREHEEIGDAVHTIRDHANDYAIPGDVCNTFVVTYQKLKEFEDDLHKHVHLGNNILFPRAEQL
jgi:regulator of cell morphogenesis and NO signaling